MAFLASGTAIPVRAAQTGASDRYPDGWYHGPTKADRAYVQQLLRKRAARHGGAAKALAKAPSGAVYSPAEYDAVYGSIVAWEPEAYSDLLTDFVVGVATDPNSDSLIFLVVRDDSQKGDAYRTLETAGANMERIRYVYYDLNTVWIRDYGPNYIREDAAAAIIDHVYNRPRPQDDAFPAFTGANGIPFAEDEPVYAMDLIHGGGNFHISGTNAFMSSLVVDENTDKTEAEIKSLVAAHFNVGVTIWDRLPDTIDATGHIDMWLLPLSADKILVSEFPAGSTGNQLVAKNITDAAAAELAAMGYTVYRTPAYNTSPETANGTHYTYANAAIVNNRVFVPAFGGSHAADDATALAVFQAALPTHEIIPIDCSSIIDAAGAIHCVMNHVFVPYTPYVECLTPAGGEVWRFGETNEVKWIAFDEHDGGITAVDLYYSTDGGSNWNLIAAGEPHDGVYPWTIPYGISDDCLVKLVVHDGDGNTSEDICDDSFRMSGNLPPGMGYDFSRGAGVDHFAFGTYSDAWDSDVDRNRRPSEANTDVSLVQSDAYARLAYSDANGGDGDPNRYENPDEGWGDDSTMIVEFNIAEQRTDVERIDVQWEGYGDASRNVQLYIWDYEHGNWGNGAGLYGEGSCMAEGSADDTDFVLSGSVMIGASRYVSDTGQVTLLVYMDSGSEQTYHDYIGITVYARSAPKELAVFSTWQGSDPAPGVYTNPYGALVSCTATNPTVLNGTTQYVCTGWQLTGCCDTNGLTSGTGLNAVLMATNDAVLNWQWQTNYWLLTGASDHGSTDPVSNWQAGGTTVTVFAIPDQYYHLAEWTGSALDAIVEGTVTSSSVRVEMTAAMTLTATFAENLACLGTPEWWLASHALTNDTFCAEETEDSDGDGLDAWEEWQASTDPTDSNSVLAITSVEDTAPASDISLEWKGGTQSWQYLEFRTNLLSPTEPWKLIHSNHPPTDVLESFLDPGVTDRVRFYRIRAVRP